MRKGFTLIELAIVLVIVGLIIAGILVARSMMKTVQIQSFIKQIQFYDIAVSNFRTKYNQIPGDSNLFSPAGNNDGTLTWTNSGIGPALKTASGTYDPARFWKHMTDSGTINETYLYPGTNGLYYKAGENAPAAKIGENGTLIFAETTTLYTDPNNTYAGWGISEIDLYWHVCFNALGSNGPNNIEACRVYAGVQNAYQGSISGIDAKAVDSKMDDGMAGNGNVQATYGLEASISRGAARNYCFSNGAGGTVHPNAIYSTGQYGNVPGCELYIKMFSQGGDSR